MASSISSILSPTTVLDACIKPYINPEEIVKIAMVDMVFEEAIT